jgi:hypothetical protein
MRKGGSSYTPERIFRNGCVPTPVCGDRSLAKLHRPDPPWFETLSPGLLDHSVASVAAVALSNGQFIAVKDGGGLAFYDIRNDQLSALTSAAPHIEGYFEKGCLIAGARGEPMFVVASPLRRNLHVLRIAASSKAELLFSGFIGPAVCRKLAIDCVHFTVTGETVVVVCCLVGDKTLWVWSAAAKPPRPFAHDGRRLLFQPGSRIVDFALAANVDVAVSVTESACLVISSIASGNMYRTVQLDGVPSHVAMSRYGAIVVALPGNGDVKTVLQGCSLDGKEAFQLGMKEEVALLELAPAGWADDVLVCYCPGSGVCCLTITPFVVRGWARTADVVRSLCVIDAKTVVIIRDDATLAALSLRG